MKKWKELSKEQQGAHLVNIKADNALSNLGIRTIGQLREALSAGKIKPGKPRNVGKKTFKVLCDRALLDTFELNSKQFTKCPFCLRHFPI